MAGWGGAGDANFHIIKNKFLLSIKIVCHNFFLLISHRSCSHHVERETIQFPWKEKKVFSPSFFFSSTPNDDDDEYSLIAAIHNIASIVALMSN